MQRPIPIWRTKGNVIVLVFQTNLIRPNLQEHCVWESYASSRHNRIRCRWHYSCSRGDAPCLCLWTVHIQYQYTQPSWTRRKLQFQGCPVELFSCTGEGAEPGQKEESSKSLSLSLSLPLLSAHSLFSSETEQAGKGYWFVIMSSLLPILFLILSIDTATVDSVRQTGRMSSLLSPGALSFMPVHLWVLCSRSLIVSPSYSLFLSISLYLSLSLSLSLSFPLLFLEAFFLTVTNLYQDGMQRKVEQQTDRERETWRKIHTHTHIGKKVTEESSKRFFNQPKSQI